MSPISQLGEMPAAASQWAPPSAAITRSAPSRWRTSAGSGSPEATITAFTTLPFLQAAPASCAAAASRPLENDDGAPSTIGDAPRNVDTDSLRWHDPDQVRGSAVARTLSALALPCRS